MANNLYDKARQRFLEGAINWNSDTIKAVLVDTALYTPNFTTDEFFSIIAAGAKVSGTVTLGTKTTTGGAADAADSTFASVSGATIEAIVIYKDTGSDATSPLIAFIDTGTGLPITPNGGDIIVNWDSGTNKIFRV
jgi:hypothetical protein